MNKKLFVFLFFFHVCVSAFSSEIELSIQNIMEAINNLKLNISILNTKNEYEVEISERINDDFNIIEKSIENIIDKLHEKKSVHISLPLAIEIKNFINTFNNRQDRVYDIGIKSFFGVTKYFDELNLLFYLVNDLRWIITNFPLVDTNAWVIEPDINISYNRYKENINILEEIQDAYFRRYVGSSQLYIPVIFEKIQTLRDIANDNLNSIFFGIIMYELNAFEIIINRNDNDAVFKQLIKLEGLYQYINFIVSMADLR